MNPLLNELLADEHRAEVMRAVSRGRDERARAGRGSTPAPTIRSLPRLASRSLGWFLVALGLRLAVRRGPRGAAGCCGTCV